MTLSEGSITDDHHTQQEEPWIPADGAELTFSLDHVGIDVEELPAQIDFYRRAFDLTVELQGDVPEYNVSALAERRG